MTSNLRAGVAAVSVDAMGSADSNNKVAWAGLEEPRIAEDKAAFAGLDDHFRVALNSVRISDGVDPVVADPALKLAAFRLAKGLVRVVFCVCVLCVLCFCVLCCVCVWCGCCCSVCLCVGPSCVGIDGWLAS
jgi:hypothetical protein